MFPIRTERDVELVTYGDYLGGTWATNIAHNTDDIQVNSDASVKAEYGMFYGRNFGHTTAGSVSGGGIHISPPVEGVDFTPYSYSICAVTEDVKLLPFLFVGISPASITGTNDVVEDYRMIAVGKQDTNFCTLNASGTFALVDIAGTAYDGRNICIGIGWLTGSNAGTASMNAFGRISVRRLVGADPEIHDKFKLG